MKLMLLREALVAVVNHIPKGRLASYGQLAPYINELSGKNISAQMVGWQLSGMLEHDWSQLPWWRVVSKTGNISSVKLGEKGWKQIQLLEKEGVDIKNNTVMYMEDLRWDFQDWRKDIMKE